MIIIIMMVIINNMMIMIIMTKIINMVTAMTVGMWMMMM